MIISCFTGQPGMGTWMLSEKPPGRIAMQKMASAMMKSAPFEAKQESWLMNSIETCVAAGNRAALTAYSQVVTKKFKNDLPSNYGFLGTTSNVYLQKFLAAFGPVAFSSVNTNRIRFCGEAEAT